MRVNMGEKRHPTDFALWKYCLPGHSSQMEWDSPWGVGCHASYALGSWAHGFSERIGCP